MDAFDLLKWKKKKRKARTSAPPDADRDSAIVEDAVTANVSNGQNVGLPNEDEPVSLGREKEPMFHVTRKKLFASPISLVLIAAIIVAGIGLWAFTSFRSGLKFAIKKGSPAVSSKAPGSVGGIQFGEKKTEYSDTVTKCEGKEGEEKNKCLAEGMIDTPRTDAEKGAPVSPVPPVTAGDGTSDRTEAKMVAGDKTTPAGPSAIKGPPDEVKTVQPAANPPVPPAQKNSPPQAVASTPTAADGKNLVTPPAGSSSFPPRPAPQVVTPPARDKTLPVPIELALKDTAPFKERFERKYAEKLKEKKNKETEALKTQQGVAARPGILAGGSPVNIKDLMSADGKPLAPNVMPGAVLDGMGAPVAATTLYGVIISGDRKTAVTSKGEVSVGGKIDGDVVADITAEGIKFKSGRIMQISSK